MKYIVTFEEEIDCDSPEEAVRTVLSDIVDGEQKHFVVNKGHNEGWGIMDKDDRYNKLRNSIIDLITKNGIVL